MKIALTGDVMLGRLVDRFMIRNESAGPEDLWRDTLPLFRRADLRIANLECVISRCGEKYSPQSKVFHFRAHPRAIQFLKSAGIECVTLANNHSLDYGPEALIECLKLLDEAGIQTAGAGINLDQALEPVLLSNPQLTVAVLALTDNEPSWEAGKNKPGINYVAYDRHGLVEPYRSRIADAIASARKNADMLLVSAHVGPNWGMPSQSMRSLARQLIDLGADFYWGHSNHTSQGIETYRGKFIAYSTGDFIDDYAVDRVQRNDLSFLFEAIVEDASINRLVLHPTAIDRLSVRLAHADEAHFLNSRMRLLSEPMGSKVHTVNSHCEILLDSTVGS